MAQRARHILFRDGLWRIQENGHANGSGFTSKLEAIRTAESQRKGEIVIHGRHGQVFRTIKHRTKREEEMRRAVVSVVNARLKKEGKKGIALAE